MLSRLLIHLFEPFTPNRRLFLIWLLFVAFFLWMSWLDGQLNAVGGGVGILDLQFAFTAERGEEIFQAWGAAGRHIARTGLLWDFIYPLVYGLVLGVSLLRLFGRESRWFPFIILIPLWAVVFDYSENFLHWQALGNYPMVSGVQIRLASMWAVLKWALVGMMTFLIGYQLVRKQFRMDIDRDE